MPEALRRARRGLAEVKVAIVHYWLVNWRGGERVLAALLDLIPEADLFVHVSRPELVQKHLAGRRVRESFIAKLPRARRWYQAYLPLMPLALEQLDLRAYDLVISCESGPAKGVIVSPHAVHICYCHSPMRYLWDMYHDYTGSLSWAKRVLAAPLMHYLRLWDQVSAQRVDRYVANSRFVARRIKKYYGRDASIVYPPVDTEAFELSTCRGDYYLFVGQLVSYKRADIAVAAFSRLGYPLVVIGEGRELKRLRKMAAGNVKMLGWQPTDVIRKHYANCRALVFPGIEDFGIVPLEAMASGKPVIAFREGGALETVVEGETGVFFDQQSPESLAAAVERFETQAGNFVPEKIRVHAEKFGADVFRDGIIKVIEDIAGWRLEKGAG